MAFGLQQNKDDIIGYIEEIKLNAPDLPMKPYETRYIIKLCTDLIVALDAIPDYIDDYEVLEEELGLRFNSDLFR